MGLGLGGLGFGTGLDNIQNILFQYSRRLKKLFVKVTKAVSATLSGEEKTAEIVKNGEKANTFCKIVFIVFYTDFEGLFMLQL